MNRNPVARGRSCPADCDCKRHSPETREKIARAQRGKKTGPLSEDHRAKLRKAWETREGHSDETKAKMSATRKGKKHSPEHREAIRLALTGQLREKKFSYLCANCGVEFKSASPQAKRCPDCGPNSRDRLNSFAYRGFPKLCAICGRKDMLHGDHCHKTDTPRGILCVNCNLGIGNFKDNQDLLQKAIDYLKAHHG